MEENKQTVLKFYAAAFTDKDAAAARFVADDYVQHNPLIADGIDGLKARVTQLKTAFPALRIEVKRLVAEADYVVAHVHGMREPGSPGLAIVDIFKLRDGKLVEHWDVMQEIPKDSLNQNGMF